MKISKIILLLSLSLFSTNVYTMKKCKGLFKSPGAKIFAASAGSYMVYRVLQTVIVDQITPLSVSSSNEEVKSAPFKASIFSIITNLKNSLYVGGIMAALARVGSWPKLELIDLKKPAKLVFGITAGTTLVGAGALALILKMLEPTKEPGHMPENKKSAQSLSLGASSLLMGLSLGEAAFKLGSCVTMGALIYKRHLLNQHLLRKL